MKWTRLKPKFQVISVSSGKVEKTFDTEDEAESYILSINVPADLLGIVYYTIKKVWVNG